MKKKELKNIAKAIAEKEIFLQSGEGTPYEISEAQNEIMRLSGRIKSIEDMELIDEMVQEILTFK